MNLLLDTHALLWWLADSPRLGKDAHQAIANSDHLVYVSAASAWEIAIKVRLGRLTAPPDVAAWLPAQLEANRLLQLPISVHHAAGVERLPPHHSDPFDRLLIAQALAEDLTLVTSDEKIERYGTRILRC